MQKVYTLLPTDELNGALAEGAAVVWIDPHGTDLWDVVLEHSDYSEQAETVLAFLQSVNPQALDEAMAKGARLSKSLGTVAIETLMSLVGGHERP